MLSASAMPKSLNLRLHVAPEQPLMMPETMPVVHRSDTQSTSPSELPHASRALPVQETPPTPDVASLSSTVTETQPTEEAPATSLLGLAAAHYYGTSELTEKPQLFENTAPNSIISIPDIFPQPVVAHLLINEWGNIDQVVLEESFLSEPAKRFVIDSFLKTRFSPGRLGNLAVKSRLDIVVRLDQALSVH
ncbi:MAG: hypothetical protein RLZZ371_1974 [Pseudomonadota bacterium]